MNLRSVCDRKTAIYLLNGVIFLFFGIAIITIVFLQAHAKEIASELKYVDQYTLSGSKNLLKDYDQLIPTEP